MIVGLEREEAMKRLGSLISMTTALLFVGAVLIGGSATAQRPSDVAGVKAANDAFYAALSGRDIAAMRKVWSNDADIQEIGPRSKTAGVGWGAVGKGFENLIAAFPEREISMKDPRIKIVGDVAWVSGIEQAQRKNKAGEASNGTNFGTNIFQKQNGRWLLVYHHASAVPQ
jgi:ketosteroid isomerase-like protein